MSLFPFILFSMLLLSHQTNWSLACPASRHQHACQLHQLKASAASTSASAQEQEEEEEGTRLDDLCCLAFCCSTRNTKQRPQPSHYLWKQQRQQWQLQRQRQQQQQLTLDPSTYPPITPIDQYWGWQTRCSSGDVSKMYSESGGHFEIVVGSLFRERGESFSFSLIQGSTEQLPPLLPKSSTH